MGTTLNSRDGPMNIAVSAAVVLPKLWAMLNNYYFDAGECTAEVAVLSGKDTMSFSSHDLHV